MRTAGLITCLRNTAEVETTVKHPACTRQSLVRKLAIKPDSLHVLRLAGAGNSPAASMWPAATDADAIPPRNPCRSPAPARSKTRPANDTKRMIASRLDDRSRYVLGWSNADAKMRGLERRNSSSLEVATRPRSVATSHRHEDPAVARQAANGRLTALWPSLSAFGDFSEHRLVEVVARADCNSLTEERDTANWKRQLRHCCASSV